MEAVNRILRYLKLTPGKGLFFNKRSSRDVQIYSDANWTGSVANHKSTSSYCTYVWGNLVTWRSKIQSVISSSSAESEVRAMAQRICEGMWIRRFLEELKVPFKEPMKLFCDNQSAISIFKNIILHDKTKHVEIDRHFVKEMIEDNVIKHIYTPTHSQVADILTKALPRK